MKRPSKKTLTGLACSVALCAMGLIATPHTAQAAHTRVHAQACMPQSSTGTPVVSFLTSGGYQVNNATDHLSCPITDNDRLPKGDINSIDVYTFDGNSAGNNFIRVRACSTSRDGILISACGTGQSASGSGYQKLVLSGSELTNLSPLTGYADLRVQMVSTSSSPQRLIGYTVSD